MSCHVTQETNTGTWLNDQLQLNQVMDLIKVSYEPLAALSAAPDPLLYWTKCCLLFTFWLLFFFFIPGTKLTAQSEQNSKRQFDLMLFHKSLDCLSQHALNALIELAGNTGRQTLKIITQRSAIATNCFFKCSIFLTFFVLLLSFFNLVCTP